MVAVVEDFFDIIYSMHVETGPNGEQIPETCWTKENLQSSKLRNEMKIKEKKRHAF